MLCWNFWTTKTAVCAGLVAMALGRIGDRRALQPLIDALEDASLYVRASAAKGLGYLKDGRAALPLKKALKDENAGVREAAAQALEKLSQ